MANIGTLAISVVAKTEKFEKGIKKSKSAWLGFVKGFVSAAAVIGAVRGITSAIGEASDRIDQLTKSGRAIGVTYQEMRRLSVIAKLSGIEVTALSTGMRTLSVQVLNARRGLETSVDLFRRLKINVSDLEGMSMPAIMEKVAKAVNATADPAERLALAAQLLGRQGAAIAASADGLADAAAAAERVADSLGPEHTAAIEAANDAWTEFGETTNSVWNELAARSAEFRKNMAEGLAIAVRFWGDILIGELESVDERISRLANDNKRFREGIVEIQDEIASLEKMKAAGMGSPMLFDAQINNLKKQEAQNRYAISQRTAELEKLIALKSQIDGATSDVVGDAVDAGESYANAFEDALTKKFQQADAFEDALRQATRNALEGQMSEVEARLNALSQEADRIQSSARPRMSAGVQAKTSGFDIRGLMIGGGLNNQEQKQLDELEDQSKYLQLIYRRLGNQVAMVGA